ncbi:hypothetical protein [Acidothermus cellulolyticus]|uniref:hypothetical protein n=1 Tax=Acidothermus cellulolyticus TaxID=28049 RepID=UPI000302690E|nr:hypothetical protein [Acidothermus cellulolyticus]
MTVVTGPQRQQLLRTAQPAGVAILAAVSTVVFLSFSVGRGSICPQPMPGLFALWYLRTLEHGQES